MATELKKIYNAETAELAAKRLEDFEQGPFGKRIPAITQCWRRVWDQVIPFFAYPNEIRKLIYTTNAIESLHMQLRKVLKTRGRGHPFCPSLWAKILCRGDLKNVQPTIAKGPKTNDRCSSRVAATCDLPTIAFIRAGVLLRRSVPVPGILATHRPGAIMDKSGRRFVVRLGQGATRTPSVKANTNIFS